MNFMISSFFPSRSTLTAVWIPVAIMLGGYVMFPGTIGFLSITIFTASFIPAAEDEHLLLAPRLLNRLDAPIMMSSSAPRPRRSCRTWSGSSP